jgi:hypothetical protein
VKKILLITLISIFGLYLYWWFIIPPFVLPKSSHNIRFIKAMPFGWALDSQIRFEVEKEDLIHWIETLVELPFNSIKNRANDLKHSRYIKIDNLNRDRVLSEAKMVPELKQWMDLENVHEGFAVFGIRPYAGNLVYDKDRKIAYYNFWD